jgi:hypothetical protein
MAAQGVLSARVHEQLAVLILLSDDEEPTIAETARATIDALPIDPVRAFLARSDVPAEMRTFFGSRGIEPGEVPAADASGPIVDPAAEEDGDQEEEDKDESRVLSTLPIMQRIKLAFKGTREQRSQLVRDSNKLVSAAVLSSPKLTETEVVAFSKMANVGEDVLRIIASNRAWMKNYGVILGLARNPKTPPAVSMQMVHRLNERDLKMLALDRNVPEGVRLAAKKYVVKGEK